MTLYSKNGSIPKPQTDGTDGWVEVPEAPVAGDGQEVVWWCPPGWVVRPVKPVKDGFEYSWSQSQEQWVEHELVVSEPVDIIVSTATAIDTITLTSASDTITISGEPTINLDLGTASATIV